MTMCKYFVTSILMKRMVIGNENCVDIAADVSLEKWPSTKFGANYILAYRSVCQQLWVAFIVSLAWIVFNHILLRFWQGI